MKSKNLIVSVLAFLISALFLSQPYLFFWRWFEWGGEIGIYSIISTSIISILGVISFIFAIKSLTAGEDLKKTTDIFWGNILSGIINFTFVALFISSIVCIGIILITPSAFFSLEEKSTFSASIFLCVCLAGFLGGFVREIHNYTISLKADSKIDLKKNFWHIIFSIISSLFVSLILFLLLRAGILKSDNIDSFNIYGVTGMSAVAGYFSDKIIARISKLYKTVVDND